MKKLLIILSIFVVLCLGVYLGTTETFEETKEKILGYSNPGTQTLVGSATGTGAVLLPDRKVHASSTTTAALENGGFLQQLVSTKNYDVAYLDVQGICGNATSTTYIQPEISFDGISFYEPITPTSTQNLSGTSTVALLNQAIEFVMGTATTSPGYSFSFLTYGAPYMRFLIYANDVAVDPTDGCQAWIEYRNNEKVTNY